MTTRIWLCPECDLAMTPPRLAAGTRAQCPRCNHILADAKHGSLSQLMALIVTGLLFYIPANTFPILSLSLMGDEQHNTVLAGVRALYEEGYLFVAFVVFLCAMLIPLIRLAALFFIIMAIKLRKQLMMARTLFRLYHRLGEWGMLEIYLLGILVAIVKLVDIASVHPGMGMVCFIGLMLSEIGISILLNEHHIWGLLEDQQ
ncbi:paraquat-inducible protein A [Kistimonas scapharcae]|uniref:Paraquat-inducible protein A n=1 Tax=Kistimonas scapharcae TaxID=1036133 RepID=A0ABP8V905_9GAMM